MQKLFLHVGIASRPQPQGDIVPVRGPQADLSAVIVLRDLSGLDADSFRDGPDWKIGSRLFSSAFRARRFGAAVVSGGSAARIPVG